MYEHLILMEHFNPGGPDVSIRFRCHRCGDTVVPIRIGSDIHYIASDRVPLAAGFRMCPHHGCRAVSFAVYSSQGEIVDMYPRATATFNAEDVPGRIVSTFTEALVCHAHGCYVACAIMIRKTVEELCENFNASPGPLVARLKSLKDRAIVPIDVYEALDELRLFGNDAAHLELKHFNTVGPEECEDAIKITRLLVDAFFHFKSFTEGLRSRKQKPPAP